MSNENQIPAFRISAAVVKQLGEELVSDELTAIMELVKNSYDADADWVKITINTKDSLTEELTFKDKNGYIIIEDNGHGMDYTDIIDKWLFISVSHKRQMKKEGKTTDKQRTPLGDKGLGRLSTQRLGYILEMFTGKDSEETGHHVAIDWRNFIEEQPLENVDPHYKSYDKLPTKKGTKLVITDLNNPEIWTREGGDKFRGQLSQLIFPFKEKRPFNIFLEINGQKNDLDEINDKLRQQAVTKFTFDFNGEVLNLIGSVKLSKLQGNSAEKREIFQKLVQFDKGKSFFNYLTNEEENKKYFVPNLNYDGENGVFFNFERKFEFEKDVKKEYTPSDDNTKLVAANPGNFLGEIDEYNLSGNEEVEAAYEKLSEYKQLVKNQTGVRIFRDGFGIKPYGMSDNDWLKLSKGQTSGGSFYLLRPENVIGFVSITAKENRHLAEKTDREGFIDNAYSKNFFTLINLTVQSINEILEKTRRSFDEFKRKDAEREGGIKSFKDTKERMLLAAKQSNQIKTESDKLKIELGTTGEKVSEVVSKIKKEPLFSSENETKMLGMLEQVEKILKDANEIFNTLSSLLEITRKLESDVNYLEPKINELESQLIQFSELAGLGITAEAFTHEVYNILDRIGAQTTQILKQLKKEKQANVAFFVYVEQVKEFITRTRQQLNHLAPSLKFNRETKQIISLSAFIKELIEYYQNRFEQNLQITLIESSDFSVEVNKGKLTQIIDNLLLNSEYWIKERIKEDNTFKGEVQIEVNEPHLRISDNGYGIAPSVENNLFQAFITTKPSGEGRGLGLFIVEQLLDSLGCDIRLLDKRNQDGRKYIFQINLDPILINK